MNRNIKLLPAAIILTLISCGQPDIQAGDKPIGSDLDSIAGGQEKVKDNESAKDVVKVAVSSKDHTTLVAALKQADLVTSLSNAGPFTVFAPTNEAFSKLPAGKLDDLMKDANKEDLRDILQYHVTLSALKPESLKDGQTLGMVNGGNMTVQVKDGKITLNNTVHVITTIPASNGIIYVVDGVLVPPAEKK